MADFLTHYEPVEDAGGQTLFNTINEAKELCGHLGLPVCDHVWFVREGDDCGDEEDCDAGWDVEIFNGQFVNCLGFYVTIVPCAPEHRGVIFTY